MLGAEQPSMREKLASTGTCSTSATGTRSARGRAEHMFHPEAFPPSAHPSEDHGERATRLSTLFPRSFSLPLTPLLCSLWKRRKGVRGKGSLTLKEFSYSRGSFLTLNLCWPLMQFFKDRHYLHHEWDEYLSRPPGDGDPKAEQGNNIKRVFLEVHRWHPL